MNTELANVTNIVFWEEGVIVREQFTASFCVTADSLEEAVGIAQRFPIGRHEEGYQPVFKQYGAKPGKVIFNHDLGLAAFSIYTGYGRQGGSSDYLFGVEKSTNGTFKVFLVGGGTAEEIRGNILICRNEEKDPKVSEYRLSSSNNSWL